MSFQSLVEVTFLQHQDIIFLGDFSPAGYNQRTEEHKLHHSCRRCRQWNNRQTSLRFFGLFFPCWRFGRVAGILCLPLLTWHKHVRSRGGHRECACAFIRQKGSSCWIVTGPQQAAPGSEWLLCRPHSSASQRLHLQPYRLSIIFAQTSN